MRLVLLELNEINFDAVNFYIKRGVCLPGFKKLIKKGIINTESETKYEYLEPWIQWASVQLGKDLKNHKIFRLGDIVGKFDQKQIFETIEDRGYKVGAISPMNAENRLKSPAYFIPDPWTDTQPDLARFSKKLSLLLKQSVNDNSSGRISLDSLITIFEIILKTLDLKNTPYLIKLIFSSIIKPWKKALVLDYLLHMVHLYLYSKKSPDFSSVFLNAGAHIQHHYFYNTKYINNLPKNPDWYINSHIDPIEDMLEVYDRIIGD